MFSYELNLKEKHASIEFKGDLDIEVTEIFEEISEKLKPFSHIQLDMNEVPFVDSTGIGLLINLINTVKQNDKFMEIHITNIQPLVNEVFDILQLDEIIGKDIFK
ncbi:STAS domain-containing protein [Niallia sp. Krafla_26]|uniref:STAS domain-containing protein n=1 Tax=Niallia sp. Krafla_26 TaxID=3064703 RepID=UPI003D16DABE